MRRELIDRGLIGGLLAALAGGAALVPPAFLTLSTDLEANPFTRLHKETVLAAHRAGERLDLDPGAASLPGDLRDVPASVAGPGTGLRVAAVPARGQAPSPVAASKPAVAPEPAAVARPAMAPRPVTAPKPAGPTNPRARAARGLSVRAFCFPSIGGPLSGSAGPSGLQPIECFVRLENSGRGDLRRLAVRARQESFNPRGRRGRAMGRWVRAVRVASLVPGRALWLKLRLEAPARGIQQTRVSVWGAFGRGPMRPMADISQGGVIRFPAAKSGGVL